MEMTGQVTSKGKQKYPDSTVWSDARMIKWKDRDCNCGDEPHIKYVSCSVSDLTNSMKTVLSSIGNSPLNSFKIYVNEAIKIGPSWIEPSDKRAFVDFSWARFETAVIAKAYKKL